MVAFIRSHVYKPEYREFAAPGESKAALDQRSATWARGWAPALVPESEARIRASAKRPPNAHPKRCVKDSSVRV
jgi:hypothetical protein